MLNYYETLNNDLRVLINSSLRSCYGEGNENVTKKRGPARALSVLVHFFAVLGQTTTRNDQIKGFFREG